MKQQDLADAIGLNVSTVSRIESDETFNISANTLMDLAEFFRVSTDYLLGLTDIPDKKQMDINQLPLSEKSIFALLEGRANAYVLNRLLEHDGFCRLTQNIFSQMTKEYHMTVEMIQGITDATQDEISRFESEKEKETDSNILGLRAFERKMGNSVLEMILEEFRSIVKDISEETEEVKDFFRGVTRKRFYEIMAIIYRKQRMGYKFTDEEIARLMLAETFGKDRVTDSMVFHMSAMQKEIWGTHISSANASKAYIRQYTSSFNKRAVYG